ncbi:reverse transcriptase [Tanacetum coccineum]
MEEPVLRLPDVTMPFELHTDASNFAIGGVLMQDGHPIAFESRKLNETERKYTMQEKEMTAVVYCLRIWRHYLLGFRFVIKTDNIATSYFQTQKKLSPKQARWQDFLAEFDYQLEYKPGKANVVADALMGWSSGDYEDIVIGRRHLLLPSMGDDVETFVRTYLIFQQDKIEQKKSGGLLKPLPTPKGPWKSVSMDFITCLPKSKGDGSIIVVVDQFLKYETGGSIILVVDRFSKYKTFIAAPPDVTADDTAKLFFKNVVKYWGVPHVIVSDRYLRFTGRFWTELFKIMRTDLNFSTSFHPQTNRKMERMNALLELYLRHYSEATGKSPFELVTGRQPLTPNALAASYEGAAKKMKKWADEKRRHVEFEVGDQVVVKLLPQQIKSLRKVHKGLIRRYEGPFPVIGRVGKVSYRVQLPPKLKIHPVFHVSFFKPYHGDEKDPGRGVSKRAPTTVITSYDREVEEILSDRTIRRRGVPSYKEHLIKWRDLPDSEASWEAKDLLWQFADEIKRYHGDGTTRTSRA